MTHVSIEELFDKNRFIKGRHIVPVCLYFPLGLIVCILRLFIAFNAFVAACLIPRMTVLRSCVLRTMCMVLGIIVFEENVEEKHEDAKVVITNHVTVLDHLAVDLVLSCFMPNMLDLPHIMNWWLGYRGETFSFNQNTSLENIKKHLRTSTCPMLVHPEGETTNGRKGLLKFSTWPFSLDLPVHPVVITVSRPPITKTAVSVLGSHWTSDLFWFLFTPYTQFTLKYLPVMHKTSTEDYEAFAKRVQSQMAGVQKISATNYTSADKKECLKRSLVSQQPSRPRPVLPARVSPSESIEVRRMAQQVKEVLPTVPLDVIKRDLVRTKSVDLTITNLLEGVVPYVPETPPPQPSTSTISSSYDSPTSSTNMTPSRSPSSAADQSLWTSNKSKLSVAAPSSSQAVPAAELSTAAAAFGRTPDERMLSYHERKKLLIENARRRYIEKHGLQV